ncbi:MAG: GntR family transcriptional regulator [Pseudomonadales bacterium]|nr:GntR family transcriptional regulator [Pseudomonadales bacterium]
MEFRPVQSLTEQIAGHLEDEIIFGRLAPNERIQELKVAKNLGVSRGSVREALLILANRHLIEILPRRGAIVCDITPAQIEELSDLIAELLSSLFCRVAQKCHGESGQNVIASLDSVLNRLKVGENLSADEKVGDFVARRLALVEAGFDANTNSYLEGVLRNLMPAGQRLVYMVTQHPQFSTAGALELGQSLKQAIVENDTAEIESLILQHYLAEKALALEISIH